MENIEIQANWKLRPMSLGEATDLICAYMEGLRKIHPVFGSWVSLGKKSFEPVLPDMSALPDHVLKAFKKSNDTPPDIDLSFPDRVYGDFGVSSSFFTYDAQSSDLHRSIKKGGVSVEFRRIGEMSPYLTSFVALCLPIDAYGELHTPETVRMLLDWTIEVWQPTCAYATCGDQYYSKFIEAYRGEFMHRQLYAAWMTYVKFPPLQACLPADLPCACEALADGATLFTLSPEPASLNNPEHWAKAKRLQDIFESLHLCESEYVLYGWPHDAQEIEYKAQISQAPPDRAYVVKMAIFDGYDAERDVLLYAALLRFLDGNFLDPDLYDRQKHPRYEYQIERNPYVVEARRQIAAVQMAGASTPIEWHIGIEPNVRLLERIFSMAGIDPSRLRLRYTPFSGVLENG